MFNNVFKHRYLCCTVLGCWLGISGTVSAEDERHHQRVEDLAYGQSLFHFYQGKNLDAITRIETARLQQRLNNQPEDAELLLGGLYFDYGLPDDAEQIFNSLLDQQIDNTIRDRIWFNLARVQYDQQQFDVARELLTRISAPLPEQREAQKQYLLVNLAIQQQDFEQAANAALKIPADNIWLAYSQYNLGVSLSSAGQHEQAQQWLSQLATPENSDEELLGLLDATHLALGLTALRQQQLDQSIQNFGNVRLSGPLSSKALLGTGWAWSGKQQPEKALTYWQALVNKQQQDGASHEAILAIAYAYEQLGNKPLATQRYVDVGNQYDRLLLDMDDIILRIEDGELLAALLDQRVVEDGNSNVFDRTPPQASATAYIHPMLASKNFQQEIQHYQELLDIQQSLQQWQESLPVFVLMLAERRQAFENKKPLVQQSTDFDQLDKIQQQRDDMAAEVARIEQQEDYSALANENETDYLDQLGVIDSIINKLQGQRDLSEEQDKYRLLSGLLKYQMETDFPRRFWQVKSELLQLDRALQAARQSAESLQNASSLNDLRLDDLDQRIQGQDQQIDQLAQKVAELIEQQRQQINRIAIEAIEVRKQHLTQLRLSARYSAARLYDELSADLPGGVAQ